jgi:hypothetical protein
MHKCRAVLRNLGARAIRNFGAPIKYIETMIFITNIKIRNNEAKN